jgi:aspartyl/asparaginyl beta-hydroxylase (cupin superfamily)
VAARLFAPQFLVLYWFAITAMIVLSVLPNRPVLPAASIPELAKLRENWQIIRGEGAGAVRARPASINAAGLRTTTSYKRT